MLVAWLWMEKGASIQILTIQDFSSPILVFPLSASFPSQFSLRNLRLIYCTNTGEDISSTTHNPVHEDT